MPLATAAETASTVERKPAEVRHPSGRGRGPPTLNFPTTRPGPRPSTTTRLAI